MVRTITKAISVVLVTGIMAAFVETQAAQARQLPRQSIVHSQRLQPRENDLESLAVTDVSPSQAAEIERLYGDLLHCSQCHTRTTPLRMGSVQ
jgi:hypothetical protein